MNIPQEITIRDCQRIIDEWIQQYGVRYFSELTNLAILMEEVGETARIMARVYGDQSAKPSDGQLDLADELADIMFVVFCIANQTGINMTEAICRNIDKKTSRDQHRHRSNPKLILQSAMGDQEDK